MLSIRLDPETERRLAELSDKTGRPKTYYARLAIEEMLEDMEDFFMAVESMEDKDDRVWTLEELEEEFGLR